MIVVLFFTSYRVITKRDVYKIVQSNKRSIMNDILLTILSDAKKKYLDKLLKSRKFIKKNHQLLGIF